MTCTEFSKMLASQKPLLNTSMSFKKERD